jgi:hypothetical protein
MDRLKVDAMYCNRYWFLVMLTYFTAGFECLALFFYADLSGTKPKSEILTVSKFTRFDQIPARKKRKDNKNPKNIFHFGVSNFR